MEDGWIPLNLTLSENLLLLCLTSYYISQVLQQLQTQSALSVRPLLLFSSM